MKWVNHDLIARDSGGVMVKRLGTHGLKTQCASTEVNLWSRSFFYINFQVLQPESQEGSSLSDTLKPSLSSGPELLRLALGPVCTPGPTPSSCREVGEALSPQVQWGEQQEQGGRDPPTARHVGAPWAWWGPCPRLGLGQPGQGGACAHA